MNRVRIVALGAVALGATVFAGTKFQQQRDVEAFQAQLAAQQVAPASDASLVTAQAQPLDPFGRGEVSLTSQASEPAPSIASAEPQSVEPQAVAPELVTASALPLTFAIEQDGSAELATVDGIGADNSAQPRVTAASVVPSAVPGGADLNDAMGPILDGPLNGTSSVAQQTRLASTEPLVETSNDPAVVREQATCEVFLVATPAPAAMLEVSVYAPCDRGQQAEMSHAGLSFDTHIGEDGQLMVQIPALSQEASVVLTFADGRVHTDSTSVDDVSMYERAVLQSRAPAYLGLNAYEFGAAFGDTGHVHMQNAREPGVSGFLSVLGDPTLENGQMAQVYTYPIGISQNSDAVTLEIEAAISEASCGHMVEASAIGVQGGMIVQERAINMTMPDCDGVGGYVILQDVLPEQSVAMN